MRPLALPTPFLWLLFGLLLWPALVSGQEQTFSFSLLNRTYEAFIEELAPVEVGPATILLTSPDHSLTLRSHQVTLSKRGPSLYGVDLELRFGGRGLLDADVSMGAIRTQLSDELAVPAQTLRLEGAAVITRGEQGYTITTTELPASVRVRIESRLAKRLFGICHQMVLVLVSLDCAELEASLTDVEAPLPPPGESYWLGFEDLTDAERRVLDAFLLR